MKQISGFRQRVMLVLLICGSISCYSANRVITFVNNCSYPVWFGLSSGSAQNTHPKFPGDTSCVATNDCPSGSSCVPTGNLSQCFWNAPVPANGNYQLNANGGSNTVTIPIFSNQNIIWSGAVGGRTNCNGAGCQTADCGGGTGGCKAGTGFQQPATQAEFTFSSNDIDYYDVEVINGVNIPVSMSPINTSTNSNDAPYTCGSPGAASQINSRLGSCSWNMTPPSNDYHWVSSGGVNCNVNQDCNSGLVCGISFNPGQAQLLKKSCGTQLGYWTADQICGVDANYGAPFNCQQRLPGAQNYLNLTNLYACTNTGSCYSNGATDNCCGCVNWDKIGIKVPSAPLTNQCQSTNPNWNNYVQGTLSWLKEACPTAYVYPFDDMSSTFTCSAMQGKTNLANYVITYCPKASTPPSSICSTPSSIQSSFSGDKKNITLSWSPPNDNSVATSYQIKNWEKQVLWQGTDLKWTDTTLPGTNGTFVYYIDSVCNGSISTESKIEVTISDTLKCMPPANINLIPSADKKSVTINWGAPTNSLPVTIYSVKDWQKNNLWQGNSTQWTDNSLPGTPGNFDYYLQSTCSNFTSAVVKASITIP